MRLQNFSLVVLALFSAAACRTSHADTLKLVSTSGKTVAGVEVYPYNLSLNGSATTTSMMCINYDDHVTVGESWQVNTTTLSTSSSVALQEDAWLFSQVGKGTYSNADIQFAVWDILDTAVSSSQGFDSTANKLVGLAQSAVTAGLSNSFLSQYTVYSPNQNNQTGWTDGLPQSFIAATPAAVTPEPSSLLLLATGLFGAGALVSRRRSLGQQATTF